MWGDYLIREGDTGRELFFVLRGKCDILKYPAELAATRDIADVEPEDLRELSIPVAERLPGSFVGEAALLSGAARSASVVAATDAVQALYLERDAFLGCIKSFPELASEFEGISKLRKQESVSAVLNKTKSAESMAPANSPVEDDRTKAVSSTEQSVRERSSSNGRRITRFNKMMTFMNRGMRSGSGEANKSDSEKNRRRRASLKNVSPSNIAEMKNQSMKIQGGGTSTRLKASKSIIFDRRSSLDSPSPVALKRSMTLDAFPNSVSNKKENGDHAVHEVVQKHRNGRPTEIQERSRVSIVTEHLSEVKVTRVYSDEEDGFDSSEDSDLNN